MKKNNDNNERSVKSSEISDDSDEWTTLSDVKMEWPVIKVTNLKIIQQVNNHAKINVEGIFEEQRYHNDFVNKMNKNTEAVITIKFQIRFREIEAPVSFCGIIAKYEIKKKDGQWHLSVVANSHTVLFDRHPEIKLFQDLNQSYDEIIRCIGKRHKIDIIGAPRGTKLRSIKLQYQETDWEFLIRLAAYFGTFLLPNLTSPLPIFYFGVPSEKGMRRLKLESNIEEKISEYDVDAYLAREPSYIENEFQREDFYYYKAESYEFCDIGDTVNASVKKIREEIEQVDVLDELGDIKDIVEKEKVVTEFQYKTLVVKEVEISVNDDKVLVTKYTLISPNAMFKLPIYNEKIRGVSLPGEVVDVSGESFDLVRLKFEFDHNKVNSNAFWFIYCSNYISKYTTGLSIVPQKGDKAIITFLDDKDDSCICTVSSAETDEKFLAIVNPRDQCIETVYGMKIWLASDKILISHNDMEILLHDQDGIKIISKKNIKLIADKEIEISAKNIITGLITEEVEVACNNNEIVMNKQEIRVKGVNLKIGR